MGSRAIALRTSILAVVCSACSGPAGGFAQGRVSDSSGAGISGARISSDVGVSASTGGDGEYEVAFENIAVGTLVRLTASKEGYTASTHNVNVIAGTRTVDFVLEKVCMPPPCPTGCRTTSIVTECGQTCPATCSPPNVCDGDTCTAPEECRVCSGGQCQDAREGLPCGISEDCVTRRCSSGVCVDYFVMENTACSSDGNECTSDVCKARACKHLPDRGRACAGGRCSTAGECMPEACAQGGRTLLWMDAWPAPHDEIALCETPGVAVAVSPEVGAAYCGTGWHVCTATDVQGHQPVFNTEQLNFAATVNDGPNCLLVNQMGASQHKGNSPLRRPGNSTSTGQPFGGSCSAPVSSGNGTWGFHANTADPNQMTCSNFLRCGVTCCWMRR